MASSSTVESTDQKVNTNGTSNGIQTNGSNGFHDTDKHFEEFKFPVPWGTVAGKWWGSKAVQPIICIHGWSDNCGTYDNLAPYLVDEGHSLLCIDLPGHGFSSHLPLGVYYYLNWDGVMVLRRIVKHYKWEKVSLMGHSLGGCISFLYAAVFPDEVSHFISIDIASPAVRQPEQTVPKIGELIDDFLRLEKNPHRKPKVGSYDKFVDLVHYAQHGNCTPESVRVLLRRGMKQIDEEPSSYLFYTDVRLRAFGLGFLYMDETSELAKQIKCKVLNIKATIRTTSIDMDYYDQICDILKVHASKFELHEVEGTHHLHLNDPQSIVHIINNFLRNE